MLLPFLCLSICALPNHFFPRCLAWPGLGSYPNAYHISSPRVLTRLPPPRHNHLEPLTWRAVAGFWCLFPPNPHRSLHFKQVPASGLPIVFSARVTAALPTHPVVSDHIGGTLCCHDASYPSIHLPASAIFPVPGSYLFPAHACRALTPLSQTPAFPFDLHLVTYCAHGGTALAELAPAIASLLRPAPSRMRSSQLPDRLPIGALAIFTPPTLQLPDALAIVGYPHFPCAGALSP